MSLSGPPDKADGPALPDETACAIEKRTKRPYRHKRSPEERSEAARSRAVARIPTEPHPDNVKLVGPVRPFEGYPSVGAWLGAKLAEIRDRPQVTGFVSWVACENLADHIQRRLEDLAKHPDRPLSAKAIGQLRRTLQTMRAELPKTRPF